MRLVLATSNRGKVKELSGILDPLGIEVVSLEDYPGFGEIEENGATFEENAVLKAGEAAKRTGEVALADDSGLEVDYLNGQPGVHSARFAGEEKSDRANNQKLLALLGGLPAERRTARFRCVIAVAFPGGPAHTTEGTCEGIILDEPRGTGGFGYDPLFYVPEYGQTFAELELPLKNKISHRGRALAGALELLAGLARERRE
ncbi:MAG: XTP/dITP diphosphatase [Eubacteriales bacterium]